MTYTDQGNVGEALAIGALAKAGYAVAIPLQNNLPYDLIVDKDGKLSRVQVKTTTSRKETGWNVYLATSGGNTRQHTKKRFDNTLCDFVFVVADNMRMWLIPASIITAGSYITVGGSQYGEYELR